MPTISVIIPTKNEADNIGRLLRSILAQTHQVNQIIVVDNFSVDNTVQIAKKFDVQIYRFGPERCSQNNYGADKATGDYLLFLDADMKLSKGVIADCLRLVRTGFRANIISEMAAGPGFWNQCRRLEKECYLGDDSIESVRFVDKKLFWQLGGFDESLIAGEDWDLTLRLRRKGIKIGRTKQFVYHYQKEKNLLDCFRKKYYYGLSFGRYLKKHPRAVQQHFNSLFRVYLKNWQKLTRHPTLSFGLFVLKLVEFAGGGAGLIKAKISNV